MRHRHTILALTAAASLALAGCRRATNVILVTFDTTRADHMGYAVGVPGRTPNLDAVAGDGVWFSQAISPAPITLVSHATILTGLDPRHHGVRDNGTFVLPPEPDTLATLLGTRGYATHAIISAFVLDRRFGLARGFDIYDDDLSAGGAKKMFSYQRIPASVAADKAVAWLQRQRPPDRPFFLWVHFFDAHAPYLAAPEAAARFPKDAYTAAVASEDYAFGRIVAELRRQRLLDRTLLVAAADHGEGLGEHGERTHELFVYDTTIRVPLLWRGPGIPSGRRISSVVRLSDLVPTVLDLLGIPADPRFDGSSLVPLWRSGGPSRIAYSEDFGTRLSYGWSELRSLRTEEWKAIEAPRPELYDVRSDPGETHNLLSSGQMPAAARPLFAKLRDLAAGDPARPSTGISPAADREVQARLAALGYLQLESDSKAGPAPDPKDRVDLWNHYVIASERYIARDYEGASGAYRAILAEDPENLQVMGSLATCLIHLDRRDQALALLYRVLEINPGRTSTMILAATIEFGHRNFEATSRLLRTAIARQPDNTDAWCGLGDVAFAQGDVSAAAESYRKALSVDPRNRFAAAGLARCRQNP